MSPKLCAPALRAPRHPCSALSPVPGLSPAGGYRMARYVPAAWLEHPEAFSEDLWAALKRRNMSRRELSLLAGVSNSTICNLASGRLRPTGQMILKLAQACGMIEEVQPPILYHATTPRPNRLWRLTKQAWLTLLLMLGVAADALGVWDFFRG